MNLSTYLPILEWLPKYTWQQGRSDLVAGLTAGVLLVPQSIAFATIAGVPPIYGLYASVVPMMLYAFFGTCRQLSVGPVSIVSLLTLASVSTLAEPGSWAYIELTIALSLVVGVIQILVGVFQLGFLVNFLSHPVITGFTSASAIIIIISQLKHLFGIPLANEASVVDALSDILENMERMNQTAFGIGMGSFGLIVVLQKINRNIPGALTVVAGSIFTTYIFNLTNQGIAIVGHIPAGLPMPQMPPADWETIRTLLPSALLLAMISFVESIAIARSVQRRHGTYKVRPNQELLALGIAKVGGAFFQAFPTTGGFSRTAVNEQAGAQTGVAAIISALLVVLTLLLLTPLFYYLPYAVLAAIIMAAVWRLIDWKEARYLLRSDLADFAMMLVTFLGTLLIGVEEGIGLGVALSLAVMVYRTTRPHLAVLGRIPNTIFYKNTSRFDHLEIRPDLLIIRFDAQLYFANVHFFENKVEALIQRKGEALRAVILNAESINRIDSSGFHTLEHLQTQLAKRGVELILTNIQGPVRDMLARANFMYKMGKEHFFFNIAEAVKHLDAKSEKSDFENYILQTNVRRPRNSNKEDA
jgi:SulP family sulfate permease